MFNTVAPEDRLGLVSQQHDEWRQQAALDRGLRPSSASRVTAHVEAPQPARLQAQHQKLQAQHQKLQALRHFFHAPAWGHRAPRGMSH
jgi:transposase-like protein